jgi:hypothetical protein
MIVYKSSAILLLAIFAAGSIQPCRARPSTRPLAVSVQADEPKEPVKVALERGAAVAIENRTTGRISITGWDKDYIEAVATSARGLESVRVNVSADGPQKRVWLKADYFDSDEVEGRPAWGEPWRMDSEKESEKEWRAQNRAGSRINPPAEAKPATPAAPRHTLITPPANPGSTTIEPPGTVRGSKEIYFEVRLPRYAEIETVRVFRSDVEIKDIETSVKVIGDKSAIRLARVGAAEVKTNSGVVEIEGVAGLVDVITKSGAIKVSNAASDVRAVSISGGVEVLCAAGRVDISNADGPITLAGIKGDVDATTINRDVRLVGAIRENGRYRLKSMSGAVEMLIPAGSPGFTAALSSYRSNVATDFALKVKDQTEESSIKRRLIGRHGNGQAQISLDSFDGAVRLGKATADAMRVCK